jgi:hypothetical protein
MLSRIRVAFDAIDGPLPQGVDAQHHAVLFSSIFHRSRRRFIFLARVARSDFGIVSQRPLQRSCLVPWRIQPSHSSSVVRITGMILG